MDCKLLLSIVLIVIIVTVFLQRCTKPELALPKCIIFWNENQKVLKEMFVESMHLHMPDVDIHPIEFQTKVSSSNFGTLEFRSLMREKIHTVQNYVKEHDGETVLVSDIDILIYRPFYELLCLKDSDIIFQKENRSNGINTGFYLMKCNNVTYNFWKRVENEMNLHNAEAFINEQAVVNNIIDKSNIKWSFFPDTIWAYSNQPMPHNIHLHHANVTIADNKSLLLKRNKIKY